MPSLTLGQRARVALGRLMVRAVGQDAMSQLLFPSWASGPRLGTDQLLKAYSTMPWLRGYFQKISQDVGALTWQVFVPTSNRGTKIVRDLQLQRAVRRSDRTAILQRYAKAGELREIPNHPLLDLLTKGNPYFSGLVTMGLSQLHLDLVGEVAWILDTNGFNMPVGATPIPPTWIHQTPQETGNVFRIVGPGSTWDVPAKNMFWAYHPNPANPFRRGCGLAQVLGDELETDEYAAKHCHDAKTECLTRRGWVLGIDLTPEDEIATWNHDAQRLEYQRPLEIVRVPHSGPMHHWRGRGADALVTPNHRLWIERRASFRPRINSWAPYPEPWHFEESRAAIKKPGRAFYWRDTGLYDGPLTHVTIPGVKAKVGGGRRPLRGVDDPLSFTAVQFAAFLGYYVSEGSLDRAGVCVGQTEGRYVDAIRSALEIFPASWVKERSQKSGSGRTAFKWSVRHRGLTAWCAQHVGASAEVKRLPSEVFEWHLAAQFALLRALINGDGSWSSTGHRGSYFSSSETLVDDVQRLCVQVGWSAKKRAYAPHGRTEHYLSIRMGKNTRRFDPAAKAWASVVDYDGLVWCVTVPNERFFSRRNGCVMLGGNTKDWFRNRAIPPVLIAGLNVGLPELQRLEEKWLSKFQRRGAGWLPHFLGKDVSVHNLSQTFQEMGLTELRKGERDTIRQVIGMPPEIAGITESSNRSTIDAADFIYQSRLIVPRGEFLRSSFQEKLVPLFDERLVLDYVNPVQEDREFLLKVRVATPWAWSADEWRQFGGSAEIEAGKGKIYMVPFTLNPVADLTAIEPPPAPEPAVLPPAHQTLGLRAARAPLALSAAEGDDVCKALDDEDLDHVAAAANAADLTKTATPIVRTTIGKFGTDALTAAGLDITFDLADPVVAQFLRQWAATRMVETVNATTKQAIRETLADGVALGEATADLVDRIREVFSEATASRARMIARTEITLASNFGAVRGMKLGGVPEKEWLSTEDQRVRDTHKGLDHQRVAIDGLFKSSSGATAPHPGAFHVPEEDINCRCGVIPAGVRAAALTARATAWKALEAERAPYVRRLRLAFQTGFRTQERAVLAALRDVLQPDQPAVEAAWQHTA